MTIAEKILNNVNSKKVEQELLAKYHAAQAGYEPRLLAGENISFDLRGKMPQHCHEISAAVKSVETLANREQAPYPGFPLVLWIEMQGKADHNGYYTVAVSITQCL